MLPYDHTDTVNPPVAIDVGDFDNNLTIDVITADGGDGESHIYGNGGTGVFARSTGDAWSTLRDVAVGLFDMDALPDFAWALPSNQTVDVLHNDGFPSISAGSQTQYATDMNSVPEFITAADITGDTYDDLLVSDVGENKIIVMTADNLGNGTYTRAADVSVFGGVAPGGSVIVELNNNGSPDLVFTVPSSNRIQRHLGNGSGGFGTFQIYSTDTGPRDLAAGFIGPDGNADIVTANAGTNTISLLSGQGNGGFDTAINYAAGLNPYAVAIGDLNNDGLGDVVVANYGSDTVSVFLGQSDGSLLTPATTLDVDPGGAGVREPIDIKLADFNDDTVLDIVVACSSYSSGTNQPGFGTFLSHP